MSSTIIFVWKDTYAHTFVVENRLPHAIHDGTGMPNTYVIGGITYFVAHGEAMAIGAEKTLSEAEVVSEVNGCPVTTLQETFKDCTLLTKVTLPDTLTAIGGYAFYNCNKLTAIEIPDSVTSIGSHAFYNCNKLTAIEIPANVTSIGEWAFCHCDKLTSVDTPDLVSRIAS
jgi:hypothetical protein